MLTAFAISGCPETINTHGQVLRESDINQLQVGHHNKHDVQRLLGSPSTIGTFDDDRWYYMSQTVMSKPLEPHILQNRKILIIDFNEEGVIADMTQKNETDANDINPAERKTPTQGQSLGIIDQVFENLGMGI